MHPRRCPLIFQVTNKGVLISGREVGHFGSYLPLKTDSNESKQTLQCSLVA